MGATFGIATSPLFVAGTLGQILLGELRSGSISVWLQERRSSTKGKRPVFATLVSVGQDRLGDPKTTASTAMGSFEIVAKHITAAKLNPKSVEQYHEVYDVPWALELSSGQLIHGANWHNRFGIEHGLGNIQLSPQDAHQVWAWASPSLPENWHGIRDDGKEKTRVVIRK